MDAMRYADDYPRLHETYDFAVRRRIPTIIQFGGVFALLFLVVVLGFIVSDTVMTFGASMFLFIGIMAYGIVFVVQRSRDMVVATEFQNSLFAAALTQGSAFCMIVKNDGSIVYFDEGFQRYFPDYARLRRGSLDAVLDIWRVSREDAEKIFAAMQRGKSDRVVFTIRKPADGQETRIVLTLDRIIRPNDFFVMRGRDYVERTGAEPVKSSSFDAAGDLLAPLVESAPFGLYATDAQAQIFYVNRTLEEWLGYLPGELEAKSISLADLIDSSGGMLPHRLLRESFEETLPVKAKNGAVIPCFIRQHIRREGAEIKGASGIVHLMIENHDADDVKKNSSSPIRPF